MTISVPAALQAIATGASATRSLAAWWRRSKGDARALIGELKENFTYLDLVASEGVELAEVIDKLSDAEFRRLSREGFDFNRLKRGKISYYPSLEGTELGRLSGKSTEALVESIYDRIADLKIRYPHLKERPNYRWSVRVNNIRKRIWLLLLHVGND
ncbi:MAG: hypothetical protein Kow006_08110 [Gammaproteobacteria bacterium]